MDIDKQDGVFSHEGREKKLLGQKVEEKVVVDVNGNTNGKNRENSGGKLARL